MCWTEGCSLDCADAGLFRGSAPGDDLLAATVLLETGKQGGRHALPVARAAQELGLVGVIESVDRETVEHAIDSSRLPILAPVGTTEDGQLLNVNADTAARVMAVSRRSSKVLFLTPTGGILDERGEIISAVNCELDLDEMIQSGEVTDSSRLAREYNRTRQELATKEGQLARERKAALEPISPKAIQKRIRATLEQLRAVADHPNLDHAGRSPLHSILDAVVVSRESSHMELRMPGETLQTAQPNHGRCWR